MQRSAIEQGFARRLVLGLVVVAMAAGAFVVAQGPGRLTTYAGHSSLAMALTLGAGIALVAAGLLTSANRSAQPIGDLALLAAFGWFAGIWVGWNGGPPLVRTLGMIVAIFLFPVLAHLVLAHPKGRVQGSPARYLVGALYAEAAVIALVTTLFRDPFFDPTCWANCTDNVFLLRSLPGVAQAADSVHRWFTAGAAGVLAGLCLWRLAGRSGPTRRGLWPVTIPGLFLASAAAASAIARSLVTPERPGEPIFFGIFVAWAVAVILLAAGVMWSSLRTRLQRRAVARIVSRLGETPPPGALESALGSAIGDPELRIAYWLPAEPRLVDASGRPVDAPTPAPGRVTTTLTRDDRPIAVVSHTGRLLDIESQLGPAIRLALENERLQAESLAHLDELQASRIRIIDMGDDERRRIERDLHDGAQQRLLAVSYDIRLARASAEQEGDTAVSSTLVAALDEAQAALEELRDLAHGIYPAILEHAGLGPALEGLRDTAGLELAVHGVPEQRFPPAIETTAYLAVVDAVADAAARHAGQASVTVTTTDQELVITVEDDGSGPRASMTGIADRVGALGGDLAIESTGVRVRIPCA